jgi:hypothetical protein
VPLLKVLITHMLSAEMLNKCWAQNAEDRPTFAELVDELDAILSRKWLISLDSSFNLNGSDERKQSRENTKDDSKENSKQNSKENSEEKKEKSGQVQEQQEAHEQQQQQPPEQIVHIEIISDTAPPSSPPAI